MRNPARGRANLEAMTDPVTAVVFALDRGVELISDRAFNAAVDSQEGEPEERLTPQEQLLRDVEAGSIDASAEGVQVAIEAKLIARDAQGRLSLTPLGKYLAPEPEPAEAQADQAAAAEPAPAAG